MELHGIIYTEKHKNKKTISNEYSDKSAFNDNSTTISENFTKFKVKGCFVRLCSLEYLKTIDTKSYIFKYESFARFSINTDTQTLLYTFIEERKLKKHIFIKNGKILESFGEIKNVQNSCKKIFDSLLVDDLIIRLYDLDDKNLKNNLPQTYFSKPKTNYYKLIVKFYYILMIPKVIAFLIASPFVLIFAFKLLFFSPFSCEKYTGVIDKTYKTDSTIIFEIDNKEFYAKQFESMSIEKGMNAKVWYLIKQNKNKVYKLSVNDKIVIPFSANYERNTLILIIGIILYSIIPVLFIILLMKETKNIIRIRKYLLKANYLK